MKKLDKDRLDQHLMIDKDLVKELVSLAKVSKRDTVLEIGSGKGILTEELAKKAKEVYCIEIDKGFAPFLKEIKKKYRNIHLIYKNALKTKLPKFNKIVSNIPYSISEPLLEKLLKLDFKIGVFTISQRFAIKLIEEKSRVSLIMPLYFDIKIIRYVSRESFNPKPKVGSSVIMIKPRKYKSFLKSFVEYRKSKVKNALVQLYTKELGMTKNEAKEIITKINLEDNILDKQVDNLSFDELKKISAKFKEKR